VRLAAVQATTQVSAVDYVPLVQQLYIAYFGRAADPVGRNNFAAQLLQLNAPTDIQQMTDAYNNNSGIRALVDSFGNSDESKALFGSGDNAAFVTIIFQNVLGRTPDPTSPGFLFWENALNGGGLTRSDASMSIMAGALANTTPQGLIDGKLVNNRVAVATAFTAALDTDTKINAYSGAAAAALVRSMLASVDANTDVAAFSPNITNVVNTLVTNATPPAPTFQTIRAIINQRCVTCHSGAGAQAGVRLDQDAVVHNQAALIYQLVVVTRFMPYGNATGMTDDERDIVKNWFLAGAH
jgi:mono/diheme cytochrome c family protein